MKIHLLLFFSISVLFSKAQTITQGTITSFGSYVGTSSPIIDYSCGETINTTISNGTNTITQGFLQPELYSFIGILTISKNNTVNVFPNPSSADFKIDIAEDVEWTLTDAQSKIIKSGTDKVIPSAELNAGIYILNIKATNNQFNKTIKLIKN